MRPTDVLAYRRLLFDWSGQMLRDADAIRRNVTDSDDGQRRSEVFIHQVNAIHDVMSLGSVFYVSADMTAVARAAGQSMPTQELQLADLPCEQGFLMYDQPIGVFIGSGVDQAEDHVIGFAWQVSGEFPYWETDDKRQINDDTPPDGYSREVDIFPIGPSELPGLPVVPLTYLDSFMSWMIGGEPANDDYGLAPTLRATWTLMQQTLTVSEPRSGDRAERRRSARLGLPLDVLVVRLRRRSLDAEHKDADTAGDREWSHRWLVNGHWRNQWLPTRAAHRLQWISGYVKGPASKPLVVKDRVMAWVR